MSGRRPAPRVVPGGVLLAAGLAAALALPGPVLAVPSGWSSPVRILESSGPPLHSMVTDPQGAIHVAAEVPGGIRYVTNAGGGWTVTEISSGDDRQPSISFDPLGPGVHIAFARYDATDRGIFTATDAGGGWTVTRRHAGADSDPALAVRDGLHHLAFRGPDHRLLYLRGRDTEVAADWPVETIDASCCTGRPSLALTAGGSPRLAYPDGTSANPSGLKYAVRRSDGWARDVIDSHRSSGPSLVLDTVKGVFTPPSNAPHVIYVRRGAGTWYATKGSSGTSGTWSLRRLDSSASGAPDMSYHSNSALFVFGGGGKVYYQSFSGGIYGPRALLTGSGRDSRPRIGRWEGGSPRITFSRSDPGAGIWYTRKT